LPIQTVDTVMLGRFRISFAIAETLRNLILLALQVDQIASRMKHVSNSLGLRFCDWTTILASKLHSYAVCGVTLRKSECLLGDSEW
jgi:hypothetical protein